MSSRHTAQAALQLLFTEWRAFERPPLREGAPDYSQAQRAAWTEGLGNFRRRLEALDRSSWPVSQQVDWHLLRAELNGLDFNLRVLRPWERDPAFYVSVFEEQSDVPAREGPTHHAAVEVWQHRFPLTVDAAAALVAQLAHIPPLLAQARAHEAQVMADIGLAEVAQLKKVLERMIAVLG